MLKTERLNNSTSIYAEFGNHFNLIDGKLQA